MTPADKGYIMEKTPYFGEKKGKSEMSKRIFTVILALVLSLTALSFGAEAEWTGAQLTYEETYRILRLRWDECEGAVRYVASIYNSNDNPLYSRPFEAGGYKELSYSVSGGTYYGEVAAYDESGAKIATSTTEKITVPIIITSGNLTLKRDGDGTVTLSWKEVSKAESYVVNVVYMNDENFLQGSSVNVGLASSYVITEAPYEKLYQITVSYLDIDNRNTTVGTMTLSSASAGYYPGTTNTPTTYITVTVSGSTATADWSAYVTRLGASPSQYLVNYILDGEKYSVTKPASETSIELQWAGGLTLEVLAFNAFNNGAYTYVDSAAVDKDGTVIYGVRPNEGNIFGDNCVMSVGTYSSSVTWASVEGTSYYTVISTDNTTGRVSYYNTTFTYASIPLGYSVNTDFSVRVLAYTSNGQPSIVASVDYKGTSSGQTPTPTPTVCEHTFEYQSCTEVHWKHCTKCGYTSEVGEHSAANGSCSVCGRSSTSSRFDVNGNGHVDLQDAVMILRRLAHLD